MAKSTGIILAATAISFGNEWLQGEINWRIPVAGLGTAVFFAGLEMLSPQAAVGLATIALITVLFTPFQGNSPVQTLSTVGKG